MSRAGTCYKKLQLGRSSNGGVTVDDYVLRPAKRHRNYAPILLHSPFCNADVDPAVEMFDGQADTEEHQQATDAPHFSNARRV